MEHEEEQDVQVTEAIVPIQSVSVSEDRAPAGEFDPHRGLSYSPVTVEQAKILLEPVPDEELEVLPTGEVYASQVRYRNILNQTFRPMGWGMRALSEPKSEGETVVQEWGLYVSQRLVARAWGEQDYHGGRNERMTRATALEGAKSNALTRCCKDLGIAAQCWDRRKMMEWRKAYAVKVVVKDRNGQLKEWWRRKDDDPFRGEISKNYNPEASPSTPTTARADAEPADDDRRTAIETTFVEGKKKSGSTKKKDSDGKEYTKQWTKWDFKAAESGTWYSTFDAPVADLLSEAVRRNLKVKLLVEDQGQYGMAVLAADLA